MLQLVILDLATTIQLAEEAILNAFSATFVAFGYELEQAEIAKVCRLPEALSIEKLLISQGIPLELLAPTYFQKIFEVFLVNLCTNTAHFSQLSPSPHIEEILRLLAEKNIRICLLTHYSPEITQLIINVLNWQEKPWVQHIFTSEELLEGFPASFLILKIMEKMNVKSLSAVARIAATPKDLQQASAANCAYVIGISDDDYVLRSLKKENYTHLIRHVEDLYGILGLDKNQDT
jgi:phosphoglycolate phosphatase-like HAD superfamily hydrolase